MKAAEKAFKTPDYFQLQGWRLLFPMFDCIVQCHYTQGLPARQTGCYVTLLELGWKFSI